MLVSENMTGYNFIYNPTALNSGGARVVSTKMVENLLGNNQLYIIIVTMIKILC